MIDLSIIVPVYKVEKYIRAFFESIFQQGLSDDRYEIIVVNDGTPDRSMEVVADLLEQHNNITIIHQKNLGLSIARNVAFDRAVGEYVLYLDPDDLLAKNSLPILLEKAVESKADMVVADFITFKDYEISVIQQQPFNQEPVTWEEKTGRDLFMSELGYGRLCVWHRLHRRDFLIKKHIRFIPGILSEDMPFSHECLYQAGRCLKTNLVLNLYRKWEGSITGKFPRKYISDWIIAYSRSWAYDKIGGLTTQQHRMYKHWMWIRFCDFINRVVLEIPSFSERLGIIDEFAKDNPDFHFSNDRVQRITTLLFKISPRLLMVAWTIRKKMGKSKMNG